MILTNLKGRYKLAFIYQLQALLFLPQLGLNAQCLNPAWKIANAPFSLNEIVSNDNKDWRCTDAAQGHWEPSGGAGHFGWTEISDPCATTTAPEMGTLTITGVYCTTAFGNGEVADDGGESIIVRGIVYNTSTGPTTANNVVDDTETSVGSFSNLISDLSPSTTYYARAYARNAVGTTYSNEVSFSTDANGSCTNCTLACDKSRSDLIDPNPWPIVVADTDTVCVTTDITVLTGTTVRGMIKICNDAQVTLLGAVTLEGENSGWEGQIVYEGCNEKFIGTGSYTGYRTVDNSANDSAQMISYCATCDAGVQSQFLDVNLTIAWWAPTCKSAISALPVELLDFSVERIGNAAALSWKTGLEINNDYFEVESSFDGVNWFYISTVYGAGNSQVVQEYYMEDNNVLASLQYYRLKQVDFNGLFHYSNTRVLNFDTNTKTPFMIAFQNNNQEIEVKVGLFGVGEVKIFDLNGRLVEQQRFISSKKQGVKLKFDSIRYTKGLYFVYVRSGNLSSAQKLLISK